MFSVKTEVLTQLPKPARYAYYVLTCFRLVSYGSWKEEGEPNPFVSRRAPKSPVTRSEVSVILRDIDPFEYFENRGKPPRNGAFELTENGRIRPALLCKKIYDTAA